MVLSPLIGFAIAFLVMLSLHVDASVEATPGRVSRGFRLAQRR